MAKESSVRMNRRSFLTCSVATVISPFLPIWAPDPHQSKAIGKNDFSKVTLKNADMLRERVFETSEEIPLVRALFPGNIADLGKYPCAYALYLDGKSLELVWGFLSTGMDDQTDFGFRDDFKRILGRVNPRTRLDTLLLLELYGRSYGRPCFTPKRIEDIYNQGIHGRKEVDDILAESRGILLWHHQMEMLIHASAGNEKMSLDEVIALRKDINIRKVEAWNLLKSMKIESVPLYDVVQERMIFSYTSYPYFRGAVALYRAVN